MQDARKIAADGIVLLKNEGDLLPLTEKELALFGAGTADEVPHSVPKRTNRKYKPVGGPTSSGSTTALYVDSLGIPN